MVGSGNSSNSNRLVDTARACGARSYLIEDETAIDPTWLTGAETVGVTAGASAPESLVQRVCAWLAERGVTEIEELAGALESGDVRAACRAPALVRPASARRAVSPCQRPEALGDLETVAGRGLDLDRERLARDSIAVHLEDLGETVFLGP